MNVKYFVIVGAAIGAIIGALLAEYLDIHMGLTIVFFLGLGFLLVEKMIRDKIDVSE